MADTTLKDQDNADAREIKRFGLKFGIITGLIELFLMYGSYYAGMESFLLVIQIVSRLIPYTFLILIIAGISLRKQRGNFLSQKQGLQFAFLAYVICEVITAIGIYLLYNVIDRELTIKSVEMVAKHTRNILPKELSMIQNQKTGVKEIVGGLGYLIIFDFMKAMVIAFLIKRERKVL